MGNWQIFGWLWARFHVGLMLIGNLSRAGCQMWNERRVGTELVAVEQSCNMQSNSEEVESSPWL